MKKMLTRLGDRGLYHYAEEKRVEGACFGMRGNCSRLLGNCTGLRGDCTGLLGDCSGLSGDCSGLSGDCSRLSGDLDACEITDAERKGGVEITALAAGRES